MKALILTWLCATLVVLSEKQIEFLKEFILAKRLLRLWTFEDPDL